MAGESSKLKIITITAAVLCCVFLGCATRQTIPDVQKSQPPQKLAYYSDSFDELRADLWDPAGRVFHRKQFQNYKSADMGIENGKLIIRTKTGSFSKGGLGSNFKLKGNYDVQIDCQIDFWDDESDLDQILAIAVMEEGPAGSKIRFWVSMSLIKKAGEQSGIFVAHREGRKIHDQSWHQIGDFNGSFRIVRSGNRISTFYRTGEGLWQKTNVFPSIGGDTLVGLVVQNFTMGRKAIPADKPVIGRFDNFRINAAQEIIEPEI